MILYHYCSPESFLSIIQGRKLWMTGMNNMSDYLERHWAEGIMSEVLEMFKDSFEEATITQFVAMYNALKFNPFICCFSTDGDLLSQWRAYAADGHGFAIGFNSSLFQCPDSLPKTAFSRDSLLTLNRVEYGKDEQRLLVTRYMAWALKQVQANLKGEVPPLDWLREQHRMLPEGESNRNLEDPLNALAGYAILAKNPAFKEEQEYRLVHMPMILANRHTNKTTHEAFVISETKYRISGSRVCPYFEYDFSEYVEKGVIAEIVAGPKNQTSDMDLRSLIGSLGCEGAKIRYSSASYR